MAPTYARWRIPLLAAIAMMGAGACSDPAPSEDGADSVTPDVQAIQEETTSPTPEAGTGTAEAPVSQRGNLIKQIGETAGILDEQGGEAWVEFAVTGIEVDGECTDPYAEPAENGHFLIVSLSVSTGSHWPDEWGDLTIDFTASDWSVVGPDGLTQANLDTLATYACLADRDELPYSIGRGENVVGKIALDTSADSGVLVYKPWYGGGVSGWEWEF